jgi:DNA-binding NarL/FixJ family response regulator
MANGRIRVLCVDDHPMVLEGVSSMVGRQPDMELVGTATSGEQAVALFRQLTPDVTLMDLQLPAMSGLEAIRAIRKEHQSARIIVLTIFHGDEDIRRALDAGASTYVLKDVRSEELLRIVREVYSGERLLPSNVASRLAATSLPALTPRELEVLELMAKGMRNKEIGFVLGISNETIKVHVKNILAKLNVNDRMAAINVALHRGLIHIEF